MFPVWHLKVLLSEGGKRWSRRSSAALGARQIARSTQKVPRKLLLSLLKSKKCLWESGKADRLYQLYYFRRPRWALHGRSFLGWPQKGVAVSIRGASPACAQ